MPARWTLSLVLLLTGFAAGYLVGLRTDENTESPAQKVGRPAKVWDVRKRRATANATAAGGAIIYVLVLLCTVCSWFLVAATYLTQCKGGLCTRDFARLSQPNARRPR